jgi:MoaA/NifB/PqqE/SkfB family radical SAM enzyme
MPDGTAPSCDTDRARADAGKFRDPQLTAKGEQRAEVALDRLRTLWINTGTLCNIACEGCYIESSPRNDRLVYFAPDDLQPYLDEIGADGWPVEEIGFTGGEPFMNPHIVSLLEMCLERGYRVLVLTNAMKPMTHKRPDLLRLRERFGELLTIRVSLDHHSKAGHEQLRGVDTWEATIDGLRWLGDNGFSPAVAGRTIYGESEAEERAGYAALFAEIGLGLDTGDPARMVLFPEMDETADVPEITIACWGILHKDPRDVMCASSRMVVKRRKAAHASVVACTLLPYDMRFDMGRTLAGASRAVPLNHPHCAKFCVLGGASCSG